MSLAEVQSWVDAGLIEWPGHVPVRPWLAQASVFVLPSYREGVPRSTQEAMALGLPIVTTDVPGCRETVAEGKDRKSVVSGKSVSVRVDLGGRRIIQNQKSHPNHNLHTNKLAII